MTPAENHAYTIGRRILALARSMDGTTRELTEAHDALAKDCESSPSGPGWQWMAQASIVEAIRFMAIEKPPIPMGSLLVACEETRDLLRAYPIPSRPS
jgi:hypothetical protein